MTPAVDCCLRLAARIGLWPHKPFPPAGLCAPSPSAWPTLTPLLTPFPSLGRLCQRSPRAVPASLRLVRPASVAEVVGEGKRRSAGQRGTSSHCPGRVFGARGAFPGVVGEAGRRTECQSNVRDRGTHNRRKDHRRYSAPPPPSTQIQRRRHTRTATHSVEPPGTQSVNMIDGSRYD